MRYGTFVNFTNKTVMTAHYNSVHVCVINKVFDSSINGVTIFLRPLVVIYGTFRLSRLKPFGECLKKACTVQ